MAVPAHVVSEWGNWNMITLGKGIRQVPAIGLSVIKALKDRGPIRVVKQLTGCKLYADDGSEMEAWIPIYKDQTDFPAETREQVVAWMEASGLTVKKDAPPARVRVRVVASAPAQPLDHIACGGEVTAAALQRAMQPVATVSSQAPLPIDGYKTRAEYRAAVAARDLADALPETKALTGAGFTRIRVRVREAT